jgi:methionyl-tRNA formyltransferase
VAQSVLQDQTIRIWEAQPGTSTHASAPGTILEATAAGIEVACGACQSVRLLRLQLPGGKQLSAQELLNSKQSLFKPGGQFV